jgi:acetyltransferase-like isoleucine patch superfamily enzyme
LTRAVIVRIHPTADVSKAAEVGDGTQIWHEAQVREGARIGRYCRIGKGVYVDVNVRIGDNCKLQNRVSVYQGVAIGDRVFLGPHVCFTNDLFPRAARTDWEKHGLADRAPKWEVVATRVEDGATIGANATILCGITIGASSMVGAGAVVTKDVPPYALVYGNPAKIQGYVCDCGRKLNAKMYCAHCKKTIRVKVRR